MFFKVKDTKMKDNEIFVVTGEFPHLSIDTKIVIADDDYNYCLRERYTNNISLVKKNKCFKNLVDANNMLLLLLQEGLRK